MNKSNAWLSVLLDFELDSSPKNSGTHGSGTSPNTVRHIMQMNLIKQVIMYEAYRKY